MKLPESFLQTLRISSDASRSQEDTLFFTDYLSRAKKTGVSPIFAYTKRVGNVQQPPSLTLMYFHQWKLTSQSHLSPVSHSLTHSELTRPDGRNNADYIRYICVGFPKFLNQDPGDATLEDDSRGILANIRSGCANWGRSRRSYIA